MTGILALILVVLCVASLPQWSYSKRWGYFPAIVFGVLLLVLLVLASIGEIIDYVGAYSSSFE